VDATRAAGSTFLVDIVAHVTILQRMHDHTDPKDVLDDSVPSEQDQVPAEGAEEPKAQAQEEGQAHDFPSPPFGADSQAAMMEAAIKMLAAGIVQLMNKRSINNIPRPPHPEPATMTMPRDVAVRALHELYKQKPSKDGRQFRVGMGVGAMINMMGVQVLSEDLFHMVTSLFNRSTAPRPPDLSDILRDISSPPVARRPDYDPFKHFEMPPGSQYFPDGVRADLEREVGEDLGFGDIPSFEEIRRRLQQVKIEDPEKADELHRRGFDDHNLENMFDQVEDLLNCLYDKKPSSDEPEPTSDEPESSAV